MAKTLSKQSDLRPSRERFLRISEVATILRVRERTVRRWIAEEHLRGTPAGPRIWLVSEADFADFLASWAKVRP